MQAEVDKCLNDGGEHDCPYFSTDEIENAINKIGLHATPGHDFMTAEHLIYAHPLVIVILARLFNIWLFSGHLPAKLCLGITTPIPKFKGHKSTANFDDFRGITANPVISKIWEICILPYVSKLKISDRQFGFKNRVLVQLMLFIKLGK